MAKTIKETAKPKAKQTEIAIAKKITPITEKITSLKINSPASMKEATEYLSQCNVFLDKLTEEKEKITKPMNEALKEVRSRYKPTELLLEQAISSLRSSISKYQTEQLRIKQEKEAKISERAAAGTIKVETAIRKMEDIKAPAENIQTDTGSLRFRTDKILKITDPLKIPREYLIIDEKSLLSTLKLGNIIPGAEIEEIQVPINSR